MVTWPVAGVGLHNHKVTWPMAWAHHVIRGSERGNSGKSRGSRYIYFVFFCFVPFSPYLSIVVMTLPLSCVRPSLIDPPKTPKFWNSVPLLHCYTPYVPLFLVTQPLETPKLCIFLILWYSDPMISLTLQKLWNLVHMMLPFVQLQHSLFALFVLLFCPP